MNFRSLYLVFFLLCSLIARSNNEHDAYFFSRVDYQQGLSNSAVLCLFQDNTGLMWFGTYDGVNCWDGKSMEIFRSDFSANQTLSNNVIHSISQADSACLWISTHLGINRLSQQTRRVVGNYELEGDYSLYSNSRGDTWVLASKGIYYYNTHHHRFIRQEKLPQPIDSVLQRGFVTEDGNLWLFPSHTGEVRIYHLDSFNADSLQVKYSASTQNFHSKPVEDIFYQNGMLCFIDSTKDLYAYDISRKSKIYIRNLSSLIQKYGTITGVVPFHEDIAIAFRANGLIRLHTSDHYTEEMVDRNIRIYGIYRDPIQGILWIASDGQGAVMYAHKYSIASNLLLNRLSAGLSRQVRSLMTDSVGGLWFGTKGDGLIHLPDYHRTATDMTHDAMIYSPVGKLPASAYAKWDQEFHVYKLLPSRYLNGFWIGAGNPGLYYYSRKDDRIHEVKPLDGQPPVVEIHGIYEQNDSVLYAATAGVGFYKLILDKRNGAIRIRRQKHYRFYHEQREISMFYPLLADGDSLLWLGSREKGLVRFNLHTEEYQVISLKEMLHKSVDDVLSLCRTQDGKLYVGTTSGLVCLSKQEKQMKASYIGREQGLLNDMIHGIVEDGNGLLWLGTNRGLIKYNPQNGSSHDYYYSAGVQMGEFSDDAYYRCPYTGNLFFGGVDGLLWMDHKVAAVPEFNPDILLRRMWIGRTEVSLGDYYADNGKSLRLKNDESSFTLSFAVSDYLTGEEIEYSFMLEGYDDQWTSFSSLNEATYTGVPPGSYVFKVRYKKDVFDTEYKSFSIPVRILPPWYRSTSAYIAYALLLLATAIVLFRLARKYLLHERMLGKLFDAEGRKKQSGFSGNDGRNVLNSFTLIYQACDPLRAENISYEQRCAQVELIRETVLNTLFCAQPIDVDKIKQFYPVTFVLSARMCMAELSQEVLHTLQAEGRDTSSLECNIPDDYTFPIYKNALRCILYYCYQYLIEESAAPVTVATGGAGEHMDIRLSSAQPAALEALAAQLSRKSTATTKGKNAERTFTLQMLLGFVQASLEQLHADIRYEKQHDGQQGTLTLTFPPANLAKEEKVEKKTILLLEDSDEMIWLITGLLSEEYDIQPVKTAQAAFEKLRVAPPTLFLADIRLYTGADIEYIAKNRSLLKETIFIPLMTLKANSTVQRELLSWSDSYLVLPYDILFLRQIIHKAIYGKREAARIYLEDYGIYGGDRLVCTTNEQADFARKMLQTIERNLDEEGLSVVLLSDRMGMSPRQFYRQLKEITDQSPTNLIKDYRMEKAARLLQDNSLSIQEIIDKVGIASRSYFYKEFARKFGVTPKEYRNQQIGGQEGGIQP